MAVIDTEKTFTVWMVETGFCIDVPFVKRYQAVRIGGSSATVIIRGGSVVLRRAAGRKFFTDEAEMWQFMRRYIAVQEEKHRRAAEQLKELLATSLPSAHVQVIPCEPLLSRPLKLD